MTEQGELTESDRWLSKDESRTSDEYFVSPERTKRLKKLLSDAAKKIFELHKDGHGNCVTYAEDEGRLVEGLGDGVLSGYQGVVVELVIDTTKLTVDIRLDGEGKIDPSTVSAVFVETGRGTQHVELTGVRVEDNGFTKTMRYPNSLDTGLAEETTRFETPEEAEAIKSMDTVVDATIREVLGLSQE